MGCEIIGTVRYTGANPGADSNDYLIFNPTDQPAYGLQMAGVGGISVSLEGDDGEGGTLELQAKDPGEADSAYRVVHSEDVTFGTDEAQVFHFLIANYAHVRAVFTNDGSAKTLFKASTALINGTDPSQ